jgi:predicted HicB family RNase H-like nuclease
MTTLKYKGYTAEAIILFEEGIIFGEVQGLKDVITFEAKSVAEVTRSFHDAVDSYLRFCAEAGESPEKPVSGNFIVRLGPDWHRQLLAVARDSSVSLNTLIKEAVKKCYPIVSPAAPCTDDVMSAQILPSDIPDKPKRGAANRVVEETSFRGGKARPKRKRGTSRRK